MEPRRYSITIDAPREKVWKTMLEDATYRQWTSAFNEGGSYFEGSWEQGSEIRFIGPDPATGELGGMYSRIHESRPHEFVSIEHLGIIVNGVVDTTSDEAKKWAPAFENYTFRDVGGATEVLVELDMNDEFAAFFDETWPVALGKLKALAEAARTVR